eukprot:g52908.t1
MPTTRKIVEVQNVKFDESTRGIDANVNERPWSFDDPPRLQPVQSVEKVGQTSREYRDILQQETEQADENLIGVDSNFDASPVVSFAPLATTVPSATHDTVHTVHFHPLNRSPLARPKAPRDIDGNVGGQNIVDGKRSRKPRPPHHSSHSVKLAYEDDVYNDDNNDDEVNVYMCFGYQKSRRGLTATLWPHAGRRLMVYTRLTVFSNDASFPPAFINSRTSLPWYENLKRKLDEHKFRYKAMGEVKVFTGLQFRRFDSGLLIHQRAYIRGLLRDRGYANANPVPTPATVQEPAPAAADSPLRQWSLPMLIG